MQIAISVKSLLSSNSEFGDYDGLLSITRFAQLSSAVSVPPKHPEYLFKLRSRKLVIDPLSLPPETSRNEVTGANPAKAGAAAAATAVTKSSLGGGAKKRAVQQLDPQQLIDPLNPSELNSVSCGTAPPGTKNKFDF